MSRATRKNDRSNRAIITGNNGRVLTESASPVKLARPKAAFARLKHPTEMGVYYSSSEGNWVKYGWSVWPIAEWEAKFGQASLNVDGTIDSEGRYWEFFGYIIPALDDEE